MEIVVCIPITNENHSDFLLIIIEETSGKYLYAGQTIFRKEDNVLWVVRFMIMI